MAKGTKRSGWPRIKGSYSKGGIWKPHKKKGGK